MHSCFGWFRWEDFVSAFGSCFDERGMGYGYGSRHGWRLGLEYSALRYLARCTGLT